MHTMETQMKTETMTAITRDRYGPPAQVLTLDTIPLPTPAMNQVRVQVKAASINPYDWHMLTGLPYLVRMQAGLRGPNRTVPGVDFAGRVDAVGSDVTEYAPGDEVFGNANGTLAQFALTSPQSIVRRPVEVTAPEAASVPLAGFTALQGLRDKGQLIAGQDVLINGAAGGVGTLAVQIATALGATVTAVCSARNVDLVESLGAAQVIDYTADDFAAGTARYDLILDNVGNRRFSTLRSLLKPGGRCVLVGTPKGRNWAGPITHVVKGLAAFSLRAERAVPFIAERDHDDLMTLAGMLERGEVKPVIDRRFDLADSAEAFDYIASGHARAKVVVSP